MQLSLLTYCPPRLAIAARDAERDCPAMRAAFLRAALRSRRVGGGMPRESTLAAVRRVCGCEYHKRRRSQ